MSRFHGATLSLLRVVSAFLFFCHGAMKLLGWFGGAARTAPLGALAMTAGVLELFGGALLAFGLFTRPVAFILSGEMAVAYFKAHARGGFWPIENHGELAVLYCFLFLFLSAAGGGSWSVDAWWRRPRISSR